MKLGWIITSVIHGTAILAAVFSFGSVTPLELDNVVPVEVEIIAIAPIEQVGTKKEVDLTTKQAAIQPIEKIVKKPIPRPVIKPKVEPKPKPKPVVKPKPIIKPKPVVKPKVEPTPKPVVEKVVEPTPEALPEKTFIKVSSAPKPVKRPPLPKAKPKEQPKPKELPEPLDDNKIAALLDKLESDPVDDIDLDFGDTETGTLNGEFAEEIEVASLSQFEFNAVKNRMVQCWSIPAGAQDAGDVVVKVGFKLNQFAEVIGQPEVLNFSAHPSFNVMAESAVRAIIECGPYEMLPPEKFDVWSDFTMVFDPRSMFSG